MSGDLRITFAGTFASRASDCPTGPLIVLTTDDEHDLDGVTIGPTRLVARDDGKGLRMAMVTDTIGPEWARDLRKAGRNGERVVIIKGDADAMDAAVRAFFGAYVRTEVPRV